MLNQVNLVIFNGLSWFTYDFKIRFPHVSGCGAITHLEESNYLDLNKHGARFVYKK